MPNSSRKKCKQTSAAHRFSSTINYIEIASKLLFVCLFVFKFILKFKTSFIDFFFFVCEHVTADRVLCSGFKSFLAESFVSS